MLAMLNVSKVRVFRRPRVALLSSGNELKVVGACVEARPNSRQQHPNAERTHRGRRLRSPGTWHCTRPSQVNPIAARPGHQRTGGSDRVVRGRERGSARPGAAGASSPTADWISGGSTCDPANRSPSERTGASHSSVCPAIRCRPLSALSSSSGQRWRGWRVSRTSGIASLTPLSRSRGV